MSGIGLVFNPRAGANRHDPGAPRRLARQLGDHGVVAAPRTVDELARVAEDFRRQDINVLGIAGGDGTNYVTLTHFHRAYAEAALPTIALLGGGTMNVTARALGLPRGKTDSLLDDLVLRYLETPTLPAIEQWTMEIEGKLGFMWCVGVGPAFLREYYETGSPSPWTAVKTLARGFGSLTVGGTMIRRVAAPVEVSVEVDGGDSWPAQRYLAVAAGTIEEIGLGFKPFTRCREQRAKFHLLGVQTNALGFVRDMPKIHRAEPMSPGKYRDAVVSRAVIRASQPLRYTVDGDLFEHPSREMTLKIGPMVRIATMS